MLELYGNHNVANLNLPKKKTEAELIALVIELEQRALKAEKKLESFEYVLAYANDIVAMWPEITMRTLWRMTDKVATLKNALKDI
jgi:hypothetical protein